VSRRGRERGPGDWLITLRANRPDPDAPHEAYILDILSGEGTDEEDARVHLEGWAELLMAAGHIPDAGEFRSLSPIAVTGRAGRLAFRVRADCFERETETGWTTGAGTLRAEWREA
jgi:hypothetical protein